MTKQLIVGNLITLCVCEHFIQINSCRGLILFQIFDVVDSPHRTHPVFVKVIFYLTSSCQLSMVSVSLFWEPQCSDPGVVRKSCLTWIGNRYGTFLCMILIPIPNFIKYLQVQATDARVFWWLCVREPQCCSPDPGVVRKFCTLGGGFLVRRLSITTNM